MLKEDVKIKAYTGEPLLYAPLIKCNPKIREIGAAPDELGDLCSKINCKLYKYIPTVIISFLYIALIFFNVFHKYGITYNFNTIDYRDILLFFFNIILFSFAFIFSVYCLSLKVLLHSKGFYMCNIIRPKKYFYRDIESIETYMNVAEFNIYILPIKLRRFACVFHMFNGKKIELCSSRYVFLRKTIEGLQKNLITKG